MTSNEMPARKSAPERRYDAIKGVMDRHLIEVSEPTSDRAVWVVRGTVAELVADIRTLTELGRTERWRAAVATWAALVEEHGHGDSETNEWASESSVYFAMSQGHMYPIWANA